MSWKGHTLLGLTAYLLISILLYFLGLINIRFLLSLNGAIAFILCIYFCLFPDCDTMASKIHRVNIVIMMVLLFLVLFWYKPYTMLLLICVVGYWLVVGFGLKHRGCLHTYWAGLLFAVIVGVATWSYIFGLYVLAGYLSHIWVGDKIKFKKKR